MEAWIHQIIGEKKILLDKLTEEGYFDLVEKGGQEMAEALQKGNKILTAGNGGSAADAQHFTGEVIGRFLKERGPLPAVTLTVDPTVMTALGNDYGYEEIIARQVAGLGQEGDFLLLISTSGNSENLLRAARIARKKKMNVIGLLGRDGGTMKEWCDIPLVVTDKHTPRIQEIHTFTVHLLCQIIEENVFREVHRNDSK